MNDNKVKLWISINKQKDKTLFNTKPTYNKKLDKWIKQPNGEEINIPKSLLELELGGISLRRIIFNPKNLIDLGDYVSLSKMDKEENCFYFFKSVKTFDVCIVGKLKPLKNHYMYSMDMKKARKIFGLNFVNNLNFGDVYKLNTYEFKYLFYDRKIKNNSNL